MTYPPHEKARFYKYVTIATAIKILETRAVRYSCPTLFNDPFDIQSGLHFDFDVETLPSLLLERMKILCASSERPKVDTNDPFGKSLIEIWEHRETYGFPVDLQDQLRPLLGDLVIGIQEFQKEYQRMWWETFVPRLRVFCVTEANDNLLMWSHYAMDHTGVAIEFSVLPELDNPLCVAGPVQYEHSPPALFTRDQWLNDITAIERLDQTAL